jgi:hypothetical protein
MRYWLSPVVLAFALMPFAIGRAEAQVDSAPGVVPGWSVTPAMSFSGSWDDNVLFRGRGDDVTGDYASAITPRVGLDFNGRRGKVSGAYSGGFVMYRNLSSLNSFDQHANLTAQRRISRRFSLSTRNSISIAPTTELAELVGVPYVRTGSQVVALTGGLETTFTKRTSATVGYSFESVAFDEDPVLGIVLRGGHVHGGSFKMKHTLDEHLALTADYNRHDATIPGGDPITGVESFGIQGSHGGVEYKVSNALRVNGSLGFSRLSIGGGEDTRTGLSWRAGLSQDFERAAVSVGYSRAFTPSYGFGGTSENEELLSAVRVPLGRRMYSSGSFAWRRNTPLIDDLRLRSISYGATVGYAVAAWMHFEGFYSTLRQNIARPGGQLDRNRVGFQVVTAKPVRIR